MTNTVAKKVTRIAVLVIAMIAAFMIMSTTASAMTKNQVAAEKEILKTVSNHETSVDLEDYNLTKNQLKEVQEDIYYQHPEAFNVEKFRYSMTTTGKVVGSSPVYKATKATATAEAKKLVKAVKGYKVTGSQAKKVKKIHDKLIKSIKYVKNRKHSHDAVGALVEKKAVCQGYAMAFMMIAKDNGLQVKMVMNGNHSHAWNVVKVGGKWYNVDVTWDDMGSKASTKYLLVSDSKMNKMDKNHKGRFLAAPKCTKNFQWK